MDPAKRSARAKLKAKLNRIRRTKKAGNQVTRSPDDVGSALKEMESAAYSLGMAIQRASLMLKDTFNDCLNFTKALEASEAMAGKLKTRVAELEAKYEPTTTAEPAKPVLEAVN